MKIKLLGKNLDDVRPLLKRYGFEESENFEMIVTYGGDGALLGAERDFPGVPKLPLRDAATARPCPAHDPEKRLQDFLLRRELVRLPKLCGSFRDRSVVGINDLILYNGDRLSALRYRVKIDGELYASEIVGDGAVLASVHGSTAYYRSITHSIFRVGLGLAFSNSTEEINHLVLGEDSVVEIEVLRGPAILAADNAPCRIEIPEHGVVTLRQSADEAQIFNLKEFMCPVCRMLRHPDKHPAAFPL
ncbi:MAG: hypothetical protein MJ016_03740 [Victivallaceae bacterium]|nr:hypothetical protein [Victivallaceae bacterium]